MLVKYGIEDGWSVNRSRFNAEIDATELAQCTTLESAQCAIARDIQAAFEERVSWYSDAMEPEQARKLWEAAKAAQEEANAGK